MTCKMCLERGKPVNFDNDPICYFDSPGHNWMCATVLAVRNLCPPNGDPIQGIHTEYCDDDRYATIKVEDVWNPKVWETGTSAIAMCLYLSWYKDRGHQSVLLLLGQESFVPRSPTEDELLQILKYYKDKESD